MPNLSKIVFGSKEKIEASIEKGLINERDIIFLDSSEIAWIDGKKQTVISTVRTNEDILITETNTVIPSGTDFHSAIKMIAQNEIAPEYEIPDLNIELVNIPDVVEIGTSITPSVRATFTQNDAGSLNGISIDVDGEEIGFGTFPQVHVVGTPVVVGDELVVITATASFNEGEIKNTNIGNPYPEGHIEAGGISDFKMVEGARKIFYGCGNEVILNSENIRALNGDLVGYKSEFEFVCSAGNKDIIIALPEGMNLNNVEYVGMNDECIELFDVSTVSIADARGNEGFMDYKVFKYSMNIQAIHDMKFRFSIGKE